MSDQMIGILVLGLMWGVTIGAFIIDRKEINRRSGNGK